MKKTIIAALIFVTLATSACGKKSDHIAHSKIMDVTASSNPSNPNAPEVTIQVKGSGGNDAALFKWLNWYNWYTGGKPNIPTCGPQAVSKECYNPSQGQLESCSNQAQRV